MDINVSYKDKKRIITIDIYGYIGGDEWFKESDTSSNMLQQSLSELDIVAEDTVKVKINSDGGNFWDGLAIYNMLSACPATVETYNLSRACSAASIIFMSGSKRVMCHQSKLMIHNASLYAQGNKKELEEYIDYLSGVDDQATAIYCEKSGQKSDDIKKMLDSETWFNGDEAVEIGLATETLKADTKVNMCFVAKQPPTPKQPPQPTAATADEVVEMFKAQPQLIPTMLSKGCTVEHLSSIKVNMELRSKVIESGGLNADEFDLSDEQKVIAQLVDMVNAPPVVVDVPPPTQQYAPEMENKL